MADKYASLDFVRTVEAVGTARNTQKSSKPSKKAVLVGDFDKAEAVFVRGHGVVQAANFDTSGEYRFQVRNLSVVFSLSRDNVAKEMLQLNHKNRLEIKGSMAGKLIDVDFFVPKGGKKSAVSIAKFDEVVTDQAYISANPKVYNDATSLFTPK